MISKKIFFKVFFIFLFLLAFSVNVFGLDDDEFNDNVVSSDWGQHRAYGSIEAKEFGSEYMSIDNGGFVLAGAL